MNHIETQQAKTPPITFKKKKTNMNDCYLIYWGLAFFMERIGPI